MNESLVLGYVHPGNVDAHFMQSVVNVLANDAGRKEPRILNHGGVIAVGSGPRIAEARNQVVSDFLRVGKAEWLLMIDTDMVFPNTALDKIMEAGDKDNFPIVGGLCFGGGRSGIMFPTMYRLRKAELNQSPVEVIEDYPDDAMCEVDATGAAFLLIHRSVLEHMGKTYRDSPYPWFLEGSVYKGTKFGEDWAFCMRAKEAGYKIHVHTGVKIGHVKPQVLDEDAWFAFKAKKAEVGEAAVAQTFKEKIMGAPEKPERVPTYAVIPQKGRTELTDSVVKQLLQEGACDGIFIMDNGSEIEARAAQQGQFDGNTKVHFLNCAGQTIHQMWNGGVALAKHHADTPEINIAILNNDLKLGPHFIKRQTVALRADKDLAAVCPNYDQRKGSGVQYVQGTWGNKGMSGFAFMIKGELFDKPFDEEFQWWYGDDDFVITVNDSGKHVGFVYGADVHHIHGGSQTARHLSLDEVCKADRARFIEKHGFTEREDGALIRELERV